MQVSCSMWSRMPFALSGTHALHPPRSKLVRLPPPLTAMPSSLPPLLLPPPTSLCPTSSYTSFPLPRLAFHAPCRGRSPPFPPPSPDREAGSHRRMWLRCHWPCQAIGRAPVGAPDSEQAVAPIPHHRRAAGQPSLLSSPNLDSLE